MAGKRECPRGVGCTLFTHCRNWHSVCVCHPSKLSYFKPADLTWLINPTILLPKLVSHLRKAGARYESRDLQSEAELRAINADIIVNCTRLGAKDLLQDTQMVPIRGQLVILKNPTG